MKPAGYEVYEYLLAVASRVEAWIETLQIRSCNQWFKSPPVWRRGRQKFRLLPGLIETRDVMEREQWSIGRFWRGDETEILLNIAVHKWYLSV